MKYQNVLQHSEEDCGAACLASIAKYHGRILTITHIREAVGTGQLGTTMLGLIRGAEALGFNARAVKTPPEILDWIDELPLPAIVHWKGYHWVVFYGQRGRKYVIADPAIGIRYLSRKELLESWTKGMMLLLEPDPVRFSALENDRTSNLARFLAPVWKYRTILGEVLLINSVLGLLSLALPFLIQILTDDVLVRGDRQLLTRIAVAVAIMQLMSSGLRFAQSTLVAHFAQRLELGLILEFGRKILRLPLSYYESHRSGEIVSRLRDIEEINQLISQAVVSLPSQLFVAIISLWIMISYSQRLSFFAVAIAIVMSSSTIFIFPYFRQKIQTLLVTEAENQGVLVETFKGALTVKTTTSELQLWQELQSRFGKFANLSFQTIQIGILNRTFSSLVSKTGDVALLWFGSSLVIDKELSIGQLLAFNSMNDNFLIFIDVAILFIDDFMRANTAIQRLSEVIDSTSETQDTLKKPWTTLPSNADIICTNLNYHYPGRVDLLVDFSVTIPGGKVTAIVGKSGCGKSTVAKLIASLYPLTSGNIRIGIYNLNDLALDCLRKQVVLIPQDAHFWSRSILENFRLSAPQASFESIIQACIIAEADEFISQLPDKYQTILGEFGANLSGGQRQRLAIARGIVNDPSILILDESTAGLDPVSESDVLDRLLAHRQGKTTILISHRPRVITRADWIIYLEKGQLELQGSVEDLRSHSGAHLDFLTP
jgi:ATP-binding cassette, subfamily C, bacterial